MDSIWYDEIVNTVTNKAHINGLHSLKKWEKLIYSFYETYLHVKFYKNNNIEDILMRQYYNCSNKEKEEMYILLFRNLEKNIIENITILKKYDNVIGDNNEPVKAIKEEINKQVENIKTTTSIDKVEEALENAEKAVKALANEINELEGTRKSKINDLKAKFDDLTDEAKLNLYNSYLAEMNAVNLNNYKEDADGEGNDSFDVIIAKAEEALKALEASI